MILYRNVFFIIGILFFIFSALMMTPAIVDFCLIERTGLCFFVSGLFGCFIGGLLYLSCKTDEVITLNTKERILVVLLSWLTVPVLSSLPFLLSPFQISFIDCIFEATSALTTTGASVIHDIRGFSGGFLLWRSLIQLTGGICFIISCIYVFSGMRSIHSIPFEQNNRLERIDLIKQIKIILSVYLSLIFVSVFMMAGSGVASVIDSISYSIAAITSSGINLDGTYVASESIHGINCILAILMFIGGCSVGQINHFISDGFSAFKNKQFIYYLLIILTLTIVFSFVSFFTATTDVGFFEMIEKSFFSIISSVTTTGTYSNSLESSGPFADTMLYVTNFIGGCSGSCTGGIKIFRIIIIFLLLKSYFIKLLKTSAVYVPTYAGKKLGEIDVMSLFSYFTCYAILAIVFSAALSYYDLDFGKSFGAVLTTMNNNGPYFTLTKASALEISELSSFGKAILISAMISGRVEFIPLFVIFNKAFWKK